MISTPGHRASRRRQREALPAWRDFLESRFDLPPRLRPGAAHRGAAPRSLYRKRWQIELLFRWIKQHLKIRAFLGRSENAIRLQLYAAMIAYLLLRTAARDSRSPLLALRFADLVRTRLFERRPLAEIDKPPSHPTGSDAHNQLNFAYG
jgi:hypothetical protein